MQLLLKKEVERVVALLDLGDKLAVAFKRSVVMAKISRLMIEKKKKTIMISSMRRIVMRVPLEVHLGTSQNPYISSLSSS